MKDKLLHLREDIICGLHSGFPPCCIKFWVTKWVWSFGTKANREHWAKIRRVRLCEVEYIPCPKCLKNKTFVKVKSCPKNCPKKKLVKKYIKELKKKNGPVLKGRDRKRSRKN